MPFLLRAGLGAEVIRDAAPGSAWLVLCTMPGAGLPRQLSRPLVLLWSCSTGALLPCWGPTGWQPACPVAEAALVSPAGGGQGIAEGCGKPHKPVGGKIRCLWSKMKPFRTQQEGLNMCCPTRCRPRGLFLVRARLIRGQPGLCQGPRSPGQHTHLAEPRGGCNPPPLAQAQAEVK